jgi:hypothetical protein
MQPNRELPAGSDITIPQRHSMTGMRAPICERSEQTAARRLQFTRFLLYLRQKVVHHE